MDKSNLTAAIEKVNAAIQKERERLEKIAQTDEASPISVEGTTSKGYYCNLMVDPKEVAKIMLEYDYPVWSVLGEDAPDDMWNSLAYKFGLGSISAADI